MLLQVSLPGNYLTRNIHKHHLLRIRSQQIPVSAVRIRHIQVIVLALSARGKTIWLSTLGKLLSILAGWLSVWLFTAFAGLLLFVNFNSQPLNCCQNAEVI